MIRPVPLALSPLTLSSSTQKTHQKQMTMIYLPSLKRLQQKGPLDQFAQTYLQCAGLPIPSSYLYDPDNRVYAIYYRQQMIGGFILGQGQSMRTLEVFAQATAREGLYQQLGAISDFTEITCFWISPETRNNTALNTFIWLSLAYSLNRFGTPKILFGTCSASLARLYGVTSKSQLLHRDFVEGKQTFVFQSERKVSLQGFLEILRYKLLRTVRIKRRRQVQRSRQRA